MANNSALKQDIRDYIYTNHNEEITGNILRDVLLEMVDTLGAGWIYKGVAALNTQPGTPDTNVFYLATVPGTYQYFKNSSNVSLTVSDGEVAIFKIGSDGSWSKDTTGAATKAQLDQLGQKIDDLALGKFYGFFPAAADLPAGDEPGYAYVGASSPFAIYVFNEGAWSDSGSVYGPAEGNGEDIDTNSQGKLQFANRGTTYGMGYKILRRDATFASQVGDSDTIYEIRYDFDLGGASVTIPAGCILLGNGGSISDGRLILKGDNIIQDVSFNEVFINIKGSDILIEKCRIINNDTPAHSIAAYTTDIVGNELSNISVKDCYIEHLCDYLGTINFFCAYDAENTMHNCNVTGCIIKHKDVAITLGSRDGSKQSGATIRDNRIYFLGKSTSDDDRFGFAVSVENYWEDVTIENNYLEGERSCVELVGSANVRILGNRLICVDDFSFNNDCYIIWSSAPCKTKGDIIIENNIAEFRYPTSSASEMSFYHAGSSQYRIVMRNNVAKCNVRILNSLPKDMTTTVLSANDTFNIILDSNQFEFLYSGMGNFFQQASASDTRNIGCRMIIESRNNLYKGPTTCVGFNTSTGAVTKAGFYNDIFWNTANFSWNVMSYYISPVGDITSDIFTLKDCYILDEAGETLYSIDRNLRRAGTTTGLSVENGYWNDSLKKRIYRYNNAWLDAQGRTPASNYGTTRPTLATGDAGYVFYDQSFAISRPVFWGGSVWKDANGLTPYLFKGNTASRPTPTATEGGVQYYDTDLKKMILWNGSAWVNMDGSALA